MQFSLTDLIYSFYLNGYKEQIQKLYKESPKFILSELSNHFSLNYRTEVYDWLVIQYTSEFKQDDIDDVFASFAMIFHKHVKSDYLLGRGITIEQINEYKLGSTHCFENSKLLDQFIEQLSSKHNPKLINTVCTYHAYILETNKELYGDPHCSIVPCFDNNGLCRGIVYRTESYVPKDEQLRNLYKFYVSHAPSYLFNQHIINNYDTIFIVEGVFDALSLIRLGYPNVVSTSHNRVSKYQHALLKDKKIIIIYDNDLGGLCGLEYFYKNYHNTNVKYYQTEQKDIDEWIRNYPNEAKEFIEKCLNS